MTFSLRMPVFAVFAACLMLSGCAETELVSHWAKQMSRSGEGEAASTYKVGTPYKVGSVWYYPQENFRLVETGIASWYGPGFHANKTANGERFDQNELTAAHRTLQLPSIVRVTNLENGRSVIVRVNDRGPFKHGRVMDVSRRAAELLGFINKGTARVRIEVMEKESRVLANAAGGDGETPAVVTYVPAPAETQVASLEDATPESLRTPTITVEELKAPASAASPVAYKPVPPAPQTRPVEGEMKSGRFMPSPVVSTMPVAPTGIFIQAGSFSVHENAMRLSEKLQSIAPTRVEPVTVDGRTMYRVKLGPISSVEKADAALEKVIKAGQGSARVIKR